MAIRIKDLEGFNYNLGQVHYYITIIATSEVNFNTNESINEIIILKNGNKVYSGEFSSIEQEDRILKDISIRYPFILNLIEIDKQ